MFLLSQSSNRSITNYPLSRYPAITNHFYPPPPHPPPNNRLPSAAALPTPTHGRVCPLNHHRVPKLLHKRWQVLSCPTPRPPPSGSPSPFPTLPSFLPLHITALIKVITFRVVLIGSRSLLAHIDAHAPTCAHTLSSSCITSVTTKVNRTPGLVSVDRAGSPQHLCCAVCAHE